MAKLRITLAFLQPNFSNVFNVIQIVVNALDLVLVIVHVAKIMDIYLLIVLTTAHNVC